MKILNGKGTAVHPILYLKLLNTLFGLFFNNEIRQKNILLDIHNQQKAAKFFPLNNEYIYHYSIQFLLDKHTELTIHPMTAHSGKVYMSSIFHFSCRFKGDSLFQGYIEILPNNSEEYIVEVRGYIALSLCRIQQDRHLHLARKEIHSNSFLQGIDQGNKCILFHQSIPKAGNDLEGLDRCIKFH